MGSRETKQKLKSSFHGLQLLLVQSSVCILALIVVLCVKWIGGDVFTGMASLFREAMLDDTLISAVSSALEPHTVLAMGETSEAVLPASPIVPPLVGGVITSAFGERDGSIHEGVDIAAEEGTPLKALMSGTVTTVEYEDNGYGHYVVVTCPNGEKYLYAHCSKINVKAGDTVTAGDRIALVGNTGRSTGSHLHFEWLVDDKPNDPMGILPEQTYA